MQRDEFVFRPRLRKQPPGVGEPIDDLEQPVDDGGEAGAPYERRGQDGHDDAAPRSDGRKAAQEAAQVRRSTRPCAFEAELPLLKLCLGP